MILLDSDMLLALAALLTSLASLVWAVRRKA